MLHVNPLELIYYKKYIYKIVSRGNQLMVFAHTTFSSSTNNFAHAQALSRMSSLSGRVIL